MPKIQDYSQQITPDVLNVPNVPHADLSGGLQGLKTIANANENLGEAGQKLGIVFSKHAENQYKLQQQQLAAQAYTQYSRDAQDKLFSNEQVKTNELVEVEKFKVGAKPSYITPAKPAFREVTRYKGEMLNDLGNAEGAIGRTDDWFFPNRNNYIGQVQDPETRARLSAMIDNHYNTVRGHVIDHQVRQLQKNDENIKQAAVSQTISDAYGFQTPEGLKTMLVNVGETTDALSNSQQLDSKSASIANQENKLKVAENSVLGKLKTTGSVDEAYALLDTAKDSLSQQNYDALKTKVQKAGVQLQADQTHANNVQKTITRFNTIDGFLKGKYNIDTSSDLIRSLAVSDPKAAAALKDAVESPKGYKPISDAGDTYQKVVQDVFNASSPEEVSQFVVNALKEHANGNISKEQLSILYDGAIQRSKAFLPDGSMTAAQVEIDGGVKAINQWNKAHGRNDPETLVNYMKFIAEGKSNLGAYNMAIKTTIIKQHPEAASYEDIPNIVQQGNSRKYIFTGTTKIAPHRIYQQDKAKK